MFTRLRWQLMLSHLTATVVTLVCMIAVAVLIVSGIVWQQSDVTTEPSRDARTVAEAISGLAAEGPSPELDSVLRMIVDGRLQLAPNSVSFRPPEDESDWFVTPLDHLAYIVLVGPDGTPIASSQPEGAAFRPASAEAWQGIAATALSGWRQGNRLTEIRDTGDAVAFGAYPVMNDGTDVLGAVVVASTELPSSRTTFTFWHALALFGVATIGVLSVASLFALVSSAMVAWVLSRRLTRRLEALGTALQRLSAGDTGVRVPVGRNDEVGQLARRFNYMSARLEATLRDLAAERDRVTGLLENRRQLVAGVSHELRTPVATMRGYLESALNGSGSVPPALRSDLETMEREATRLQRLIEDLFALSRAEVGRLELRIEPVDVGALLRRSVETAAPLAWGQRRVQVLAEVAGGLPAARADEQRLEQIVSNLLGNAMRHTPPGGLVVVSAAAEGRQIRIDVRDTGEGIAADDLPHIFERYYRGRGSGERGGAGLGLALAKELAEAMGGTIGVESAPGEGSCFTVRLQQAE